MTTSSSSIESHSRYQWDGLPLSDSHTTLYDDEAYDEPQAVLWDIADWLKCAGRNATKRTAFARSNSGLWHKIYNTSQAHPFQDNATPILLMDSGLSSAQKDSTEIASYKIINIFTDNSAELYTPIEPDYRTHEKNENKSTRWVRLLQILGRVDKSLQP